VSDDIILAKDIDDCSNCPLYEYDCSGGWTSGGGGTPIEPPCCSWNGDEEIYEGMYDYEHEPTEAELKWERERIAQKEREEREKREQQDKEDCRKRVYKISRYGNAKVKNNGELCYTWYCPNCRRWFHAWYESGIGGVVETSCNYCGEPLAHSSYLDD
jgi:hypothetical protein